MARFFILFLLAAAVSIPDPKIHSFDFAAYAKFVSVLDKFDRALAGCPPHYEHEYECEPARGHFDVKLWNELRKLAPRGLSLPPEAAGKPQGNAKDSAPHE